MIYYKDNRFGESDSPHSMGLRNNMTIPNPGLDSMSNVGRDKLWSGTMPGMRGLTFDGTGFLGTGLFSGDISSWGVGELIFGLIGAYAVYSMIYQGKQTKYRLEIGAGRRRKSRAAKLRARAKRLEEQTTGLGIF